jgi:hypothetical protein
MVFQSFMWKVKGEEYLKELVQQDLFVAVTCARLRTPWQRESWVLRLFCVRSEYTPFLNSGLPIKEAPTPKEGLPASSGYGVIGIVKNPPHPNTVKVLVNWFWARKDRSFMPES